MKIVFVGPTLPNAASFCDPNVIIRRPAVQGDLLRAVQEGASAIGLIDGNFEYAAPVWHKEILFGLSQGVSILGSSSMGALRAAECHAFGMVGLGEVFRRYASAELVDDADVALAHAPAEMGYALLSIPLVNIIVTLEQMVANGIISETQQHQLRQIAAEIFFKERTWARLAKAVNMRGAAEDVVLIEKMRASYVDVKRSDALMLLDTISAAHDQRSDHKLPWIFNSTSMWRDVFNHASR